MDRFEVTPSSAFQPVAASAEKVTAFLRSVYGWMFVGLGISAAVAVGVANSDFAEVIRRTPGLFWGLWIVPFVLALVLQFRVERLQPNTAAPLFIVYSALIGACLSALFSVYNAPSIAVAFVVTAGAFGAMALFGTTTKRSLAGAGHFFYMGFVGVFLALLMSVFIPSAAANSALQFVISVVGVIVFTGLTAWKAQQLKQLAVALPEGQPMGTYAVVGALQLYITFLNLFMMLLRLLGGGRRN